VRHCLDVLDWVLEEDQQRAPKILFAYRELQISRIFSIDAGTSLNPRLKKYAKGYLSTVRNFLLD